jgi:hypothetical protein
MDPYMENPDRWPGVHTLLVAKLAELLAPQIRGRYCISVEERAYLTVTDEGHPFRIPDAVVLRHIDRPRPGGVLTVDAPAFGAPVRVLLAPGTPMRERYLTVRRLNEEIVTAIEILSPTNKRPDLGRDEYLAKRSELLRTRTSLVELDLLRTGPRMPMESDALGFHYGVLVSRGYERPLAYFQGFNLRDPLPQVPVPLQPGDPEPTLDLRAALLAVYDTMDLGWRTDYREPANPPLLGPDADWADVLLRETGLRG